MHVFVCLGMTESDIAAIFLQSGKWEIVFTSSRLEKLHQVQVRGCEAATLRSKLESSSASSRIAINKSTKEERKSRRFHPTNEANWRPKWDFLLLWRSLAPIRIQHKGNSFLLSPQLKGRRWKKGELKQPQWRKLLLLDWCKVKLFSHDPEKKESRIIVSPFSQKAFPCMHHDGKKGQVALLL